MSEWAYDEDDLNFMNAFRKWASMKKKCGALSRKQYETLKQNILLAVVRTQGKFNLPDGCKLEVGDGLIELM